VIRNVLLGFPKGFSYYLNDVAVVVEDMQAAVAPVSEDE
jgi:hypothetical protein